MGWGSSEHVWLNSFKSIGKFLSLQYLGTKVAVTAADAAADIFVVPPVCSIISLQNDEQPH